MDQKTSFWTWCLFDPMILKLVLKSRNWDFPLFRSKNFFKNVTLIWFNSYKTSLKNRKWNFLTWFWHRTGKPSLVCWLIICLLLNVRGGDFIIWRVTFDSQFLFLAQSSWKIIMPREMVASLSYRSKKTKISLLPCLLPPILLPPGLLLGNYHKYGQYGCLSTRFLNRRTMNVQSQVLSAS